MPHTLPLCRPEPFNKPSKTLTFKSGNICVGSFTSPQLYRWQDMMNAPASHTNAHRHRSLHFRKANAVSELVARLYDIYVCDCSMQILILAKASSCTQHREPEAQHSTKRESNSPLTQHFVVHGGKHELTTRTKDHAAFIHVLPKGLPPYLCLSQTNTRAGKTATDLNSCTTRRNTPPAQHTQPTTSE